VNKLVLSVFVCFILSSCVSVEEREQRREARKLELSSIEKNIPVMAAEFEKACTPYLNGTPVDDVIEGLASEQYESVAILQANFTQKFKVLQNSEKQIQIQLLINSDSMKQCNVFIEPSEPDLLLVSGGDRYLRDIARDALRGVGTKFAASRGKKLKKDGNKFHIGVFIAPQFQFHVPSNSKTLGMVAVQYIYEQPS